MASEAQIIKDAFKQALGDENASMTRDQMSKILRKLDPGMTEDGINNLFDFVDANKNGIIEYAEFVDFICTLEDEEEVTKQPTRGELNREKTFDGSKAGNIFDVSRWQKALSGGAWAFACDQQASAVRIIVQQFPDLEATSPEGLTLAEEFVLVWHDKKTGELAEYSYFGADEPFHNALFGACLLGLQARRALSFRAKKGNWTGTTYHPELSDNPPEDSAVLKAVHKELGSKPNLTLKMWFEQKSGKWGEDTTTQLTLESLVERGILEQGTFGDVYEKASFKSKDSSAEKAMIKRLCRVANGEIPPDNRSVALLALCRTADVRDPSTNHLMTQIFGSEVAAMTGKVDDLVESIVTFSGIGSDEINKMLDALPGDVQQMLSSKEFREDASAQFKEMCGAGSKSVTPAKLAANMDKSIGKLVQDKMSINQAGLESVIKMFDRDQDGSLEEPGFVSFLMWCHALTRLA